ncbi:MAG: oligoendopeptidase F [Bacillota bacterium]
MGQTLKHRSDANQKDTWAIEDYFKTIEEFEEKFQSFANSLENLDQYKNQLQQSKENLLHCLEEQNRLSLDFDHLYTYATMKFHEDSDNSKSQTLSLRCDSLLTKFSEKTAFVVPEIMEIPSEVLENYLQDEAFAKYRHFFHSLLRKKSHTLSQKEEELLAKTGELTSSAETIFAMINDADMVFADIKDGKGETVALTKGRYITFLEEHNRDVRKAAFESLYQSYQAQRNTLASTYYASVKSDVFQSEVRNYDSAQAMALHDDNIPLSVYDTLVETVHAHLPLLHRYLAIRKKELNLDELHMYDLYAPLVKEVDEKISYDSAKEQVRASLKILGTEYTEALEKGFNERWIDVYENKGKRSGAYSWGSFGVHPFVLLNHNDTINSMFTLTHEMGHALHSYFTWKTQPYLYSGHKIFVAEVASTCNEGLLMQHLLQSTTDKKMRKYLINYFLEQFRGTLFRQTMFAEFESITHRMVENGEPLTADGLCEIYRKLNRQYFGDDIILDEAIDIEWARIPHFYNAFYVYQYATGFSAAMALTKKIFRKEVGAKEAYLAFLSKGDSEYSIDLLKGAGVDLSSPTPIKEALELFKTLLDEFEEL